MKFQTLGNPNSPLIIMLTGSFCPSSGLKYLYEKLKDDYCLILPEYNGHYENSTFTTRQNEAKEVVEYIQKQNIHTIKMIYGQSMGAEIAIELFKQLEKTNINVDYCFLDGAPCIKLPYLYKKFMHFKFNQILKMMKKKEVDQILNMKLIKKIARGNTENLRPMIEPMALIAQFLTKESVKNETECCYTFDFPSFDKETQNKMYFFYGKEEKAYKTCYSGVKKAYLQANSIFKEGYGHLMYSIKKTDDYIEILKDICEK
ncbi:hypothetical protein [Faecalibacillus faecis]|mgnify:CR=1 FL=1|uniref:hypothetical protein n=1 Tax=Faecalibacillus faecis TaxID=1982628 RepID=UPI002F9504AD